MQGQPIEILVVEDNEDDVLLLQESFADSRLVNVLHAVSDGEEAMQFLRREGPYAECKRPGLVLLDINMPRKNGFEVLKEMKDDPSLRCIPVVMLTTSSREVDIMRAYTNGACSFISKPVDFDKLKEVAKQFALYWSLISHLPRGE